MPKFLEFKDRRTELRVTIALHNEMALHEQKDGSAVFNDNKMGCSYYPEESYIEFKSRLFSLLA